MSFIKEEQLEEKSLSPVQRFRLRMGLRKNLQKILIGRKKMKYRLPSTQAVETRARKLFRKGVEARVRRDKPKALLSDQERQSLEKIVDKIMSKPAIQQRMIQWTSPGGKLYADVFKKAKIRLQKRLSQR